MDPKKIIFKIGGDLMEDIRETFRDPSSTEWNVTTVYLKDWKELLEALTPQRMQLLQEMLAVAREKDPCDIGMLAQKTNRKREAISRDLKGLEQSGIITKTKKGKNVYPEIAVREIVIQFG